MARQVKAKGTLALIARSEHDYGTCDDWECKAPKIKKGDKYFVQWMPYMKFCEVCGKKRGGVE